MCTLSFIARRHGYVLGMNRDEQRARTAALPPAQHRLGSREALFPSELSGGTWIGVNDSGATLALLNWYSVAVRVRTRSISRGDIVRAALPSASATGVDAVLADSPLARVNPFRLFWASPAERKVVEWRWNLVRLERIDHRWRTQIWSSSGFDEPGAQQTRTESFREALRQSSAGSGEWLRRFHRGHRPQSGPYSVCMHRADAVTVSFTEVTVTCSKAWMRYSPGAPCCTPAVHSLTLPLKR